MILSLSMRKKIAIILFSAGILTIVPSCSITRTLMLLLEQDPVEYYLEGNGEQRKEMRFFLEKLAVSEEDYETSFVLMQQLIKHLHSAGRNDKLNLLMTTYVENHPEDPFNGYYLLIVANAYLEEEAFPFAVHYYEQILKNHHDLQIHDQSIHYICLTNLTQMVDTPAARAEYFKELLTRFAEGQSEARSSMTVNEGLTYYNLARTYEQLGEWNLSIQAYKNYLRFPETIVPGSPNAYHEISDKVAYHDYSPKDWTNEDLEDLKSKIQYAIYTKNTRRLNQYRAKVNFFAQSWEQQSTLSEREVDDFFANLGRFMTRRVSYQREFDSDSNSQEAYLETFGWSYRIPTWYYYFRRISFPADPEINGRWQWEGIYFGEKPFSGSD